ncbi:MAG: UDP-N-acetylglucosamine--N-acetylmuramyl-(pentapeptide) pyrophosphoryl-undecaprenol N-acetylglucosamine transferase [Bacteroidia bacterium]
MKKVIITGGGTGGHLYPGLAISEAIQDFAEVVYVGHPEKIEARVVPEKKMAFVGIRSFPFSPKNVLNIIGSILTGRKVIRQISPDLLIAVGGYVCIPAAVAARLAGVPLLLHEQNVAPGKANRLLIRLGAKVMTSFPETSQYIDNQIIFPTGCPVRKEIGSPSRAEARAKLQLQTEDFVILSMGGSGGAALLNDLTLALVQHFQPNQKVKIIHITGKVYYEKVMAQAKGIFGNTLPANYQLLSYSDAIEYLFAAADVGVFRSGSSTVNELLCAGLPSVLIPSPNVAENHQEANARYLEKVQAAEVLLEKDANASKIIELMEKYYQQPQLLAQMKQNCLDNQLGKEAKTKIAEVVKKMLG